MSAIAGVFSRRGTPRQPGEIDQMLTVMASRGPEGARTWATDQLALGHGALNATPESFHERMPLIDPATGNVIVADVRLDNRPELIAALGLSGRDPNKIGDGSLLLHSYRTWGEDCVGHLLGDFAFAIWDERRHRLFLARDHFGAKPLTYHSSERLFAFASDSRSVRALEGVPKSVNRDRVVDFLIGDTEWFDTTSTFFSKIHRLPPAHTLTVSTTDQRLRRYWHLPEPETLRLRSDAEYEEATREILDQAVACRLRGTQDVGIMLSGGIDSASITATALRHGPVFTYSAIAEKEKPTEAGLIRQTTRLLPITSRLVEKSAVRASCGSYTNDQRHRESLFTNGAMPRTLFSSAAADGRRSVLTGVLADEVVALSLGSAMQALLTDRRLLQVIRLAGSHGNLRNQQGRIILARSALSNVLALNRTARNARTERQNTRWEDRKLQDTSRLCLRLEPDEMLRLDRRLDTTRWISLYGDSAGSLRHRLFDRGYAAAALERYERSAASCSVESRTPFMDRRVVEFFQTLPAHQLVAGGWTKSVLRRSMTRHLPDELIWSTHLDHPGWVFTLEWIDVNPKEILCDLPSDHPLHEYLDVSALLADASDETQFDRYLQPTCAGLWLEQQSS